MSIVQPLKFFFICCSHKKLCVFNHLPLSIEITFLGDPILQAGENAISVVLRWPNPGLVGSTMTD